MESVLRALTIYLILLVLLRLTGKRTLSQTTTLDFVLLLIVGEATQQALLGDDYSITNSLLVIATLMLTDRAADWLQYRFRAVARLTEGTPLILVEHGRPLQERLRRENISVEDVLAAARQHQGLLDLSDIEYAVLERTGGISIIPANRS